MSERTPTASDIAVAEVVARSKPVVHIEIDLLPSGAVNVRAEGGNLFMALGVIEMGKLALRDKATSGPGAQSALVRP